MHAVKDSGGSACPATGLPERAHESRERKTLSMTGGERAVTGTCKEKQGEGNTLQDTLQTIFLSLTRYTFVATATGTSERRKQ